MKLKDQLSDNLSAEELRALAEIHRKRAKNSMLLFLKTGFFLLVTLVASIALTAAWFANNRDVGSKGMETQVEVSSNLIISKDASEISSLTSIADCFSVTFEDDIENLTPARHHEGNDYPVSLEYNTNPRDVSATSGLEQSGKTLTFAPVPEYHDGYPKRYYYDCKVYIASAGAKIDASNLIATMDLEADPVLDYMQAMSIDFYVNDEYTGTLNKLGKNWDNSGTAVTELDLADTDGILIPLNTSGDYITVLMRCYFDGGLEKSATQTYVYSSGLSTSNYTLSVNFEAVDAE